VALKGHRLAGVHVELAKRGGWDGREGVDFRAEPAQRLGQFRAGARGDPRPARSSRATLFSLAAPTGPGRPGHVGIVLDPAAHTIIDAYEIGYPSRKTPTASPLGREDCRLSSASHTHYGPHLRFRLRRWHLAAMSLATDPQGAAVRENPLRAGMAERDTYGHDGIGVVPADDLGDQIALLGAQPGPHRPSAQLTYDGQPPCTFRLDDASGQAHGTKCTDHPAAIPSRATPVRQRSRSWPHP